jgi:hypothetical protein
MAIKDGHWHSALRFDQDQKRRSVACDDQAAASVLGTGPCGLLSQRKSQNRHRPALAKSDRIIRERNVFKSPRHELDPLDREILERAFYAARRPSDSPIARWQRSRAVFGAFPPLAAAGVPYYSQQTVSKVSQLSRAKASIVETINYGERGISHACLYSFRDHHLGCNRPRRLRGTSRESRRRRAVEAQLNYDEIALLTISPASANPGRFLGRGLLASRRCRSALSDSSLPADISAGADRAAVNVFSAQAPS